MDISVSPMRTPARSPAKPGAMSSATTTLSPPRAHNTPSSSSPTQALTSAMLTMAMQTRAAATATGRATRSSGRNWRRGVTSQRRSESNLNAPDYTHRRFDGQQFVVHRAHVAGVIKEISRGEQHLELATANWLVRQRLMDFEVEAAIKPGKTAHGSGLAEGGAHAIDERHLGGGRRERSGNDRGQVVDRLAAVAH